MNPRVLALCGGVGGAKLALGLYRVLEPHRLTILVNTGDDFEHLGLAISPDLDTVLYTLSNRVDPVRGWGRRDETWRFMEEVRALGLEDWFSLGDCDLALHVARTRALRAGGTLSELTAQVARRYQLHARILPMSDDPVRTIVATDRGELAFQRYFVAERCAPAVRRLDYRGADEARANSTVLAGLAKDEFDVIVLCPSNPWLSIAPMLALPGLRAALRATGAPLVAVAPIVGGTAIKGPTAKIMAELGLPVTTAAVAEYYGDLLDGYVLDSVDADLASGIRQTTSITDTVMKLEADKTALAQHVLEFAQRLRRT